MPERSLSKLGGWAIGMTLDADAFLLVRCNRQGRIVRQERYLLPENLQLGSDACGEFLKKSLSHFYRGWRGAPLWLCASTPGQQLRFLQLQRVRGQAFPEMVYWAFRKDIPFDTEKTIFDFGVHGEVGGNKVDVTVCTALHEELEAVLAPFSRAGISLCGVLTPSFALEALCKHAGAKSSEEPILVVHAGEELASVLIWQSGRVVGNRIFKTGLTSAQIRSVLQSGDLQGTAGFDSVLERLVQQLDRTMSAHLTAHADQRFSQLVLTGPLAQVPELLASLQQPLGVPCSSGQDAPVVGNTEGGWALATGAALSHYEHTPNFLHPVRAREALHRRARMSFLFALLLGVGALGLVALRGFLAHGNAGLQARVDAERTQLSVYDPEVNEEILRPFVVQVVAESQQLKQLAHRWHPYVVLHALAELTPPTAQIMGVDLEMASTARRGPVLRVNGISAGAPAQQLAVLAAYVLDLEKHRFFHMTTLRQVTENEEAGRRVLQFEVEVELAPLGAGHASVREGRGAR